MLKIISGIGVLIAIYLLIKYANDGTVPLLNTIGKSSVNLISVLQGNNSNL
jgi:hypothetical protein